MTTTTADVRVCRTQTWGGAGDGRRRHHGHPGPAHRPPVRASGRTAGDALSSRIAIEQAKVVLAERRHITGDQDFAQLRDHAGRNNLRLSDLARQVAGGSSTGFEHSREADRRP